MRKYGTPLFLSGSLVFALTVWSCMPHGSSGKSISGYVVSQDTGNPILGVYVTINGGRFADTTDGGGWFKIENLDERVQELRFEHSRYNSVVLLGDAAYSRIESGILNMTLTHDHQAWAPLLSTRCPGILEDSLVLAEMMESRGLREYSSQKYVPPSRTELERQSLYGRRLIIERFRGEVQRGDSSTVVVFLDSTTGFPSTLFGRIPISQIALGVESMTYDNVIDIAMRFMRDNKELLGVNPDEVVSEPVEAWHAHDDQFSGEISFIHVYRGMRVSNGRLIDIEDRVRFKFVDQNLEQYYSEFEPGIDIELSPRLEKRVAFEAAKEQAIQRAPESVTTNLSCHSMELIVFADRGVPITSTHRHRLCWSINAGEFNMFVDANTGELVRLTSLRMCGLSAE